MLENVIMLTTDYSKSTICEQQDKYRVNNIAKLLLLLTLRKGCYLDNV